LLTEPLLRRCIESGIDYDMRGMEKPSDHAPVWTTLEG
jgi:exodeoxyribonuclease-3